MYKSSFFLISVLFVVMTSIQISASFAKQLFPVVGCVGATTLRLSLAAIILCAVHRPWRVKMEKKDLFFLILYGASLSFMNLFFYLSIERIPLGIAVVLEFIGPLAVAIYNSKKARDFIWIILAATGIVLFSPICRDSKMLDPVGLLLALASGFFWATYIIFGQLTPKSVNSGKVSALGIAFGSITILPISLFMFDFHSITLKIVPLSLAVAIFSMVIPYPLELMVLKRLPAKTFGILMSLEPVFAYLSGLIFLNEHLTWVQMLAISLIILACFGSTAKEKPASA